MKRISQLLLGFVLLFCLFGAAACGGPQVKITFKDGEETVAALTVDQDSAVQFPEAPTAKPGKVFEGWAVEGETEILQSGHTFHEDTVLRAIWSDIVYTVTFVDWDDSVLYVDGKPDQKVPLGGDAVPPADPEREGYTFKGWDRSYLNVQGRLTLKAVYEKNSYTLRYFSLGEVIGEREVPFADKLPDLEPAQVPGLDFLGWYFDENFAEEGKVNFEKEVMTAGDRTLYAKWAVKIADLGLNADKTRCVYGEAVTVSAEHEAVSGITFGYRWSLDGNLLEIEGSDCLLEGLGSGEHVLALTLTASRAGAQAQTLEREVVITVDRKAVTVKAGDLSVLYGQEPSFAIKAEGLVLNETAEVLGTPRFTCGYPAEKRTGTFSIAVEGLASDNYIVTSQAGTLTVNKAPLTARVGNASVTYGDAFDGRASVSYTGFVFGETESAIEGTPVYSSDYVLGAAAGSEHALSASGLVSANYEIEVVPGTLTVRKRSLTVGVKPASVVYGEAKPGFEAAYAGFAEGEDASVLEGTPTFACGYEAGGEVGEYPVMPGGLAGGNYEITFEEGTLTVTPAKLTVRAEDASVVYGDGAPAYQTSFSGFVNGDGPEQLTETAAASCDYDIASPEKRGAGTYAVRPAQFESKNYTISYAEGTLTVSRRQLTARVADRSVVYGSALPDSELRFEGFVYGEDESILAGSALYSSADYAAGRGIGAYEITAAGLSADNYEVNFVPGVLTVTPKELVVGVQAQKSYDGQVWSESAWPSVSGLISDSHVMTGTLATRESAAGSYLCTGALNDSFVWTVSPKISDGTGADVTANYELTYSLNVSIQEGAIENSALGSTSVYDGLGHSISVTVKNLAEGEYRIEYRLKGQTEYSTRNPAPVSAGRHTVEYRIVALVGSYDDALGSADVLIERAPLVIRADDLTAVYGEAAGSYTASCSGFVNGETADVLQGLLVESAYSAGDDAGEYAVTPSGATADNYDITFVPGKLTVTPADLTIRIVSEQLSYGDEVPEYRASAEGVAGRDTEAEILAKLALSCGYTNRSGVGSYDITGSVTDARLQKNYRITVVGGKAEVSARAVLLTVDETKPYDGEVWSTDTPGSYASGILEGQLLAGSISTPGDLGTFEGISGFVMDLRVTDGTADVTANYAFTYALKVVITPLTLDDTAVGSAYSGAYTGENHLPAVDLAKLPAGTAVSYKIGEGNYGQTAEVLHPGSYAVTVRLVLHGYTTLEILRTVEITPAELTVTANAVSVTYGDALPAFTAVYSGFVNGENEEALAGTLAFDTDYTAQADAGTYLVTPKGYEDGDYHIVYRSADLTVLPRAVTVTVGDAEITYGQDAPASFDWSAAGLAYDQTKEVLGTPRFVTDYVNPSNAGSYSLTVEGLENGNYTVNVQPGVLTVKKADYTAEQVASAGQSTTIDGGNYDPARTLSKIVLADGFRWADGTAVPQTGSKQYEALYNADSANYNDYPVMITVTVAKSAIVIDEIFEVPFVKGMTQLSGTAKLADGSTVTDVMFTWSGIPAEGYQMGGTYLVTVGVDPADPNYTGAAREVYLKLLSVKIGEKIGEEMVYRDFTIEDALKNSVSGDTVIVTADTAFASDDVKSALYTDLACYTVKDGVTLLLPYDETYSVSVDGKDTGVQSFNKNAHFSSLILPGNRTLTVEGELLVNARRFAATPTAGGVTGSNYAVLELHAGSSLVVNGKLTVMGYVSGEGTVVANSGATVTEAMIITAFKGGSVTSKIYGTVFPFNQYSLDHIESNLTVQTGAKYYARAYIYAMMKANLNVYFMGAELDSDGKTLPFMQLQSGSVTKKFNPQTGRITFEFDSVLNFNNVSVSQSGITLNTADKEMPLPGNIAMVFKTGSVTTIENLGVKLLPGASLTVEEGATLNMGTGSRLFVYGPDTAFTDGFTSWNDGPTYRTAYPHPTAANFYHTAVTLDYTMTTPATVLIQGTFSVADGAVVAGRVQAGQGGRFSLAAGTVCELKITEDNTVSNGIFGTKAAYYYATGTLAGNVDGTTIPLVAGTEYEAALKDGAFVWTAKAAPEPTPDPQPTPDPEPAPDPQA